MLLRGMSIQKESVYRERATCSPRFPQYLLGASCSVIWKMWVLNLIQVIRYVRPVDPVVVCVDMGFSIRHSVSSDVTDLFYLFGSITKMSKDRLVSSQLFLFR